MGEGYDGGAARKRVSAGGTPALLGANLPFCQSLTGEGQDEGDARKRGYGRPPKRGSFPYRRLRLRMRLRLRCLSSRACSPFDRKNRRLRSSLKMPDRCMDV